MPRLGLGTWPMGDREAGRAVAEALGVGYRLVDTANAYGNEAGVGRGLRASGVPREEVFVTTKLNAEWHGVDGAREAWEMSAQALGVEWMSIRSIQSSPSARALISHASRAPSTPCHCAFSFVVTKTSSRGTPLARSPRPTPASFP